MRRVVGTEADLYQQIARYMAFAHAEVLYRFDIAADMKLTVGQAARHKRLHPHRGWPDLFIAAPHVKSVWTRDVDSEQQNYLVKVSKYGLFIELKREGTRLKKRDGTWANEHIAEQAAILARLRKQGYAAEFACGIDEALELIESYLGKAGNDETF